VGRGGDEKSSPSPARIRAGGSPSGGGAGESAGDSPTRVEIGRGGLQQFPRQSATGLSATSAGGGGGGRSRPGSAPLRRGEGKGGGANRPVGVAARTADRDARAKDPRENGTFGEPPPVPDRIKSLTASEARARSARSSGGLVSKKKPAGAGRAPSRPVKPVDQLLGEMHADGTMFVPKFYRGDD
jgi:hypothetical protein